MQRQTHEQAPGGPACTSGVANLPCLPAGQQAAGHIMYAVVVLTLHKNIVRMYEKGTHTADWGATAGLPEHRSEERGAGAEDG